ncbi:hypothetical protein PUN28_005936 [Cardiocondyla obscurior]|uniref:Uncharacterized protein n=1 Tax=Cardiocondyla obscurior TaxID=286306 RepID=A0AAW2G8T5_9HYME
MKYRFVRNGRPRSSAVSSQRRATLSDRYPTAPTAPPSRMSHLPRPHSLPPRSPPESRDRESLSSHRVSTPRVHAYICHAYKEVLGVSRETLPPINIFVGFNGCPVCTTSVYRRARFRMYEFAELAN